MRSISANLASIRSV